MQVDRQNTELQLSGMPGAAPLPGGERILTCSSSEPPNSQYCAAAEALMMCTSRLVSPDRGQDLSGGAGVVVRVLVPKSQISAIIGPHGTIINQVRFLNLHFYLASSMCHGVPSRTVFPFVKLSVVVVLSVSGCC